MVKTHRIKDAWPWNPAYTRLWLWVALPAGILLTLAMWPEHGVQATWFSMISASGVCFAAVYSAVGRKVRGLHEAVHRPSGDSAESLMQIGAIQSPGVVILAEDELRLHPIVGRSVRLPLDAIRSIRRTRWLFGKRLLGKTVFIVENDVEARLAFGVAGDVARRFDARLPH